MGQVEHPPHGARRVLDGQPPAQCAYVAAAAQNQADARGIHEGDAREVERQQLGQAVIDLGIDLPPQCLGGVVVDLAAQIGGQCAAAGHEGYFGHRVVLFFHL